MAANGELEREGGGRAEGEEDVDDEATFFSLDLALITGHQSSTIDNHDEEKGKKEDGNKGIDGREVAVAAGDAASDALGMVVGPAAARLRTLVRKLLKPKAAGPGRHPSGGRTPAAVEENGSRFMASRAELLSPVARRSGAGAVITAEERQSSTEAALKYLSKVPILACHRGVGDGPDDDTSPPPYRPHEAAVQLPAGRKTRGEAGLRQAYRRRLGTARSSVSVAALPPLTPPRRDDSLLQAQDGVASAGRRRKRHCAYCKLSLAPSRGFESPMVPFRG